MEDTIYRQDAVAALRHAFNTVNGDTNDTIDLRDLVYLKLNALPSAVRKGEWQHITVRLNDGEAFKALNKLVGDVHYDRCSECGFTRYADDQIYWFCPKCGSSMEESINKEVDVNEKS